MTDDEKKELLEHMSPVLEEMDRIMRAELNKEFPELADWIYYDLPWTRKNDLLQFFQIVEDENIKTLAMSVMDSDHGPIARGQFLISPKGLANAKDYAVAVSNHQIH